MRDAPGPLIQIYRLRSMLYWSGYCAKKLVFRLFYLIIYFENRALGFNRLQSNVELDVVKISS